MYHHFHFAMNSGGFIILMFFALLLVKAVKS